MERRRGLLVILVLVGLTVPAWSAEPPKPDFDRVDHQKPREALALCPRFGSAGEIRKIAKGLKQKDPLETIRAVDTWIKASFVYDADAAYTWRDFKTMRKDKTYGGCADHAVLFGSLMRAAGIPTVFVKTMDCDWIRAFAKGRRPASWSGHCFLEVNLEGKWALLDASMMRLYRAYDPSMRILPGLRYAYDKAHDPYQMVKSMRWELWKKQTTAFFQHFDLTKLPVDGGISIAKIPPRVFAAANRPYWKWLGERCQILGLPKGAYSSFNTKFDEYLRQARGHILILTCVGEVLVLPRKFHSVLLPIQAEGIQAALKRVAFGTASHVAPDGTQVVLLYARDQEAMRKAVDAFEFP